MKPQEKLNNNVVELGEEDLAKTSGGDGAEYKYWFSLYDIIFRDSCKRLYYQVEETVKTNDRTHPIKVTAHYIGEPPRIFIGDDSQYINAGNLQTYYSENSGVLHYKD